MNERKWCSFSPRSSENIRRIRPPGLNELWQANIGVFSGCIITIIKIMNEHRARETDLAPYILELTHHGAIHTSRAAAGMIALLLSLRPRAAQLISRHFCSSCWICAQYKDIFVRFV